VQQALEQFEYERSLYEKEEHFPLHLSLQTEGPSFYPTTARHLRRIFYHMMLNAWEACHGFPLCDIRILLHENKDMQTELIIEDAGRGMSKEQKQHMFVPGYSSKGKGRGRGLTHMDRHLLEKYGHLIIESEPGRGTRIRWIVD
jgi:CitB family two-component system sensor histidine kinase MalK